MGDEADLFLEVDGIKGESKDSKFPERIDILSFSYSVHSANLKAPGGTEPAGQVKIHDMTFSKLLDAASVPLARACAIGTKIPKAQLIARKAGGKQEEFFRVTLEDVFVTSVRVHSSAGSNRIPNEDFTLNFSKITWKYAQQTERGATGGPLVFGHDLAKGGG